MARGRARKAHRKPKPAGALASEAAPPQPTPTGQLLDFFRSPELEEDPEMRARIEEMGSRILPVPPAAIRSLPPDAGVFGASRGMIPLSHDRAGRELAGLDKCELCTMWGIADCSARMMPEDHLNMLWDETAVRSPSFGPC